MLSRRQKIQKRVFDIVLSFVGLSLAWWIILIAWMVASFETKSNGFFVQTRVGKGAKLFYVIKIKTMKKVAGVDTTVTSSTDVRITKSGAFFRKTKIDELPQLINVLLGTMSFVGPRPDVKGFADMLKGEDRVILSILPGITGAASLKYRDEEEILSKQEDPEQYNKEVIWLDKVSINRRYIAEWSFKKDIEYIIKTVAG